MKQEWNTMKILFLSGASSIHTVRWVNALAEAGHEIHLAYLKQHTPGVDLIDKKVAQYVLPISGTIGYYANCTALRKLYCSIRPDIVNAHYASGYGTLARISKMRPLLLSVWGSDVYEFPYQSKLKHRIITKNLLYANSIASTSYVMSKQVQKLIGERTDIAITPFGVDMRVFTEKKHELKAAGSIIKIGLVKTLAPKYGIDCLLKAFKILIAQFRNEKLTSDLRLVIYGKGNQLHELELLAKDLQIDEFVEFKGYIPNVQVPEILKQLDIFALPSLDESFGVSAVEAMAAGLPIAASDADGFTEIIVDGETGFIVPRNNPEALAEALKKLVENQNLRIQFGRAGRKRAENLYNFSKNVVVMEELYQKIYKNNKIPDRKEVSTSESL
jgi:glycosyltransferase involved in cell wall biosynthesis